jgi:hypothetical protein
MAMPAVLLGCVFASVADKPYEAGIIGALIGLVIGICILAFPDLDRGGPADNDDFIH